MKYLFVIESLMCAGAEKSLVTLLNKLDYTEDKVDLMLFSRGGGLEAQLPKDVNILGVPKYFEEASVKFPEIIPKLKSYKQIMMYIRRLRYSLMLRLRKTNNTQKAELLWRTSRKSFENIDNHYDVAIAYAQNLPTYFVAEKVSAKRRIAWINVSLNLTHKDISFQKKFYDMYDDIVCVSEVVKRSFEGFFLEDVYNVSVLHDIVDYDSIEKMAGVGKPDEYIESELVKLLTVGRLAHQKGYDIAIDAAEILKRNGYRFIWYIMGIGPMHDTFLSRIREKKLEDYFCFLGVRENPYPYMRWCDIYVQPSRFEGFGISLAEARLLHKPVIATRFNLVNEHIVDGINGLIAELNGSSLATCISKMMESESLRTSLVDRQKEGMLMPNISADGFYNLIQKD